MANKKKVVTAKALQKAAELDRIETVDVEWNDLSFVVKRVLSLEDMVDFVEGVAMSCFADDTGEYMPEAKDFAIRSKVIEKYTNIELPDDMAIQYDIVYGSDIVRTILEHVETGQINNILSSIEAKVDYLAQANIEMVMAKLNEFIDSYEEVVESAKAIYSDVTSEDIKTITQAIDNGGFDEEKIVQAYLKQMPKDEESPEETKVIPLVKEEE